MINKVILIGRLTKDPELRYTQSGIAVTRFTLAVDSGTGQECDTWTDALEYMFEEGWKKKLVDGEWEHYCPECQESEVERDA